MNAFVDFALPIEDEIDALGPKKRGSPERSVQVACVRYIRAVIPDAIPFEIENARPAASSDPQARARFHQARKAKGMLPSMTDLGVILPGGVTFWVEFKAPGGVVSADQLSLHAEIRARGHTVIVADSVESLRLGLHRAGIATRETAGQPMREARVRVQRRPKLPADPIPW